MLHLFPLGRSDNAIKQRWRLINRAKARCARGAKSCPSGVAALTDQSISNDDQLKVCCSSSNRRDSRIIEMLMM